VVQDVVTAHELSHQWFALLLASHETETPVLDEGLAEWAGLDVLREKYGRSFFAGWLGLPLDLFELHRAAYARAAKTRSSLDPAYVYKPEELSTAVYVRPALALESIARTWGRSRLHAALGAYARGARFGHPKLDDLWTAIDDGYWRGFSKQVLKPALEGVAFDTRLERTAHSGVLRAVRSGALWLPETVAALDGRGVSRLAWPDNEIVEVRAAAPPLIGASIDPDRHNLLDRARRDDQLRADASAPVSALLARLLLWAQVLLTGLGP
jgi:peptidase M1-like protein